MKFYTHDQILSSFIKENALSSSSANIRKMDHHHSTSFKDKDYSENEYREDSNFLQEIVRMIPVLTDWVYGIKNNYLKYIPLYIF